MDYFQSLLDRYRGKGLVIDSNLLLLLIVGSEGRNRVESFKRTKMFVWEDYLLLNRIAGYMEKVITTPGILTEVSNHLGQLPESILELHFNAFRMVIEKVEEMHTPSIQLCSHSSFARFGLTDVSIMHISKKRYLVLTVDLPLAGYLANNGSDVINFNHIRTWNWPR